MYSYYRKQCPPGTAPYTIRLGDTLYGIANRYNVFLNDLIKANPGINPYFRRNEFFINASNEEISVNRILKKIGGSLFLYTMFLPITKATDEIMFSFYAMMKTIRGITQI